MAPPARRPGRLGSSTVARGAWIAVLAAAPPILVADDLFGSYLRVYRRHAPGYLSALLPRPIAALPPWLIAGACLIAAAVVAVALRRFIRKATDKGRRRLEIVLILGSFACSAAAAAVYALSGVWASTSQSATLPQEKSGLAALAIAVVLLVSLCSRSWRPLVSAHGAVLLALVAAVALPRLRAEHRAEVATIHRLLERAEADLDRRRSRWHQIDLDRIETGARERGEQAGVFRFDERLSSIVALEADPRDGSASVLYAFPRDGRLTDAGGTRLAVENGVQVMPAYPGGTYLSHRDPLGIDATQVGSLFITMTVSAGSHFEVLWSDTDRRGDRDSIRIPLGEPGKAASYEIRESLADFRERGVLNRIWIMPSDRDARVEIAALRVLDRTASLGEAPFRAGYENVGNEIRRVLTTAAPSTLRWLVPVPSIRPRMRFGLATVDPEVAVTFEVLIGTGEEAQTISAEEVAAAELWRDFELDLSPWAGEEKHIALRTRSPVPGLGLWSNPVVFGERAAAAPNVVVFLVDCLRARNLGAYGYGRPTSTVFDRLAAHGTLFENAYSNGTTTKHSIPSLFTSNPISATRVRYRPDLLAAEFPTLAEVFRWSGYTTAAFATNGNAGPFSGTHQGFSRVYSATRMASAAGYPSDSVAIETVVAPLLEAWMDHNRERNFLLYVHTLDAHGPYNPPAPYRTFFETLDRGTPVAWSSIYDPQWLTTPTDESRLALYDGELVYGDEHFGRFLSKLREISEQRRTVFVFTADHGEYFGEHGMFGHGPPAFVQGVHIPLFLMGPGIPAGKRVAAPVQIMDLLPTILDAAGIEPDDILFQGRSLLPLVRGEQEEAFAERGIFIEGQLPDQVSVRLGPFHFIPEKNLWFDLRDDPLETRPVNSFTLEFALKARARALARRYREVYRELHAKVASKTTEALDLDPETLKQLRTLGYID